MTPKQEERIRNKIAKIRKELAADKKRWGGFHDDSRGIRYLPPELFVKLKDYKGGLRYLRWFDRTFPDDMGHPFFLFEWTLILFKTGNLKEAEKKAFKTFFSNKYILDNFLEKELHPLDVSESSSWEMEIVTKHLSYSKKDAGFEDFAEWLENLHTSEYFTKLINELIEIDKKLISEPVGKTRTKLVNRRYKMIAE